MSADHLLYQTDFSDHRDEWLDFDSMFQLPSEYLDSDPASVESISPRDLDQSFMDTDFLNLDLDTLCSQAMFPDLAGLEAPIGGLEQSADFQSFINPSDLQPMPSQTGFVDPCCENAWFPELEDPGYFSSFRPMVESQAAMDTRCFSPKEKRRDAAIALHLQRMNAPLPEQSTPSLSSKHLSSPNWSEFSLETRTIPSTAPSTSASVSPTVSGSSGCEPGAPMEMVLDLNMNTTTNVPKKQRPRSRAQREGYIKARKYGVCEKHRKQHKRVSHFHL